MNFKRFLLFSLATCSLSRVALSEENYQEVQTIEGSVEYRGYLPVPATVAQSSNTSTTVITPAFLGTTTTNFCTCGVYRLSRGLDYSTTSTSGCPMVRIIGSGIDFDLSHNCACFSPSGTCATATPGSHCVGIEVGYSPTGLGSNTQPNSVVIENGVMCGWDVAILVHAGVRNVTIRNMVFSSNVIPLIVQAQDDGSGNITSEVCSVQLENVYIVGANAADLNCLRWIRSYLLAGAAQDGGPAASTTVGAGTCGYTTSAIPQRVDDPTNTSAGGTLGTQTNGTGAGALVYTGIYAYGVSNLRMNNVSITETGYSAVAEDSASYGAWIRNCRSVFMQDIESTENRSSQTVAGLYIDNCQVVSLERGQITRNTINPIQTAGNGANVPEQIWAAGVVLKDSNVVNMSDLVVSYQTGYNNTWGVRTILSGPIIQSNAFNFKNVWADNLIGMRVYGFDFGDLYRKTAPTATRLAAGRINKLTLDNASISYARGISATAVDGVIPVDLEFKGIYLGDDSSAIILNDIYIANNNTPDRGNSTPTYRDSGIEWGTMGVGGLTTPSGVVSVHSRLSSAQFSNVFMTRNGASMTVASIPNLFAGFRAVVGSTDGLFKDIKITNAIVTNAPPFDVQTINTGYGFFVGDTVTGNPATGTLQDITLDRCAFDNNNIGMAAGIVDKIKILHSTMRDNSSGGFTCTVANDVIVDNCQFDFNASNPGFGVTGAATQASFTNSSFSNNTGTSSAAGMLMGTGCNAILLDNCQLNANNAFGLSITSVSNLVVKNSSLSNTTINTGSAVGLSIAGAGNGIVVEHCKIVANAVNNMYINGAAQSVVVKDSVLSGENGVTSTSNINFNSTATTVTIDNCVIDSATADNILSTGVAKDWVIKDCHIANAGGSTHGVHFAAAITGLTVENSEILNNGGSGILGAAAAAGLVFKDSAFVANTASGVSFVAGAVGVIDASGCSFDSNGAAGLTTGTTSGVILKHSTFSSNTTSGVSFTTVAGLNIDDCACNANTTSGLVCPTAADVTIANSSFGKNGGFGIGFSSGAVGVKIDSSSVDGNTGGGLGLNVCSGVFLTNSSFASNTSGNIIATPTGFYMENCQVDSSITSGAGITFATATSGVEIVNSSFCDCAGNGIDFSGTSDSVAVIGCHVDRNGAEGILFTGAASSVELKDSTFNSNQGTKDGVFLTATVNDLIVDHCNFDNNTNNGLNFGSTAAAVSLDHCSCSRNAALGVLFTGALTNLSMDHCKVNQNAAALKVVASGTAMIIKDSTFNLSVSGNNPLIAVDLTLVDSLFMQNCQMNTTTSTAHDVYGCKISTAGTSVSFDNVEFCANTSTAGNSRGLWITNGNSVSLRNVTADDNAAAGASNSAWGIQLDTAVANLEMVNVQANQNISAAANAYGIEVDHGLAIFTDGVRANNNTAGGTATSSVYGMYFKATVGSQTSEGCLMNNLQACGNHGAAIAYGVWMDVPTGLEINGLDVCTNRSDVNGTTPAFYQAAGAYFNEGSAVTVKNLHACSNTQAQLTAIYLDISASSATLESAINTTNQIAHHFPVQNQGGAYGIFINGTNDVSIDGGTASRNEGVRAFGVYARNANDALHPAYLGNANNILIKNVDASENVGHGTPFISDSAAFASPYNTNTAIPINANQASCLFGYTDDTTVNLQLAYQDLLAALSVAAGTGSVVDPCSISPVIPNQQNIASMYRLIWSAIAPVRRFSTGLGFGFYNCSFPTVECCRAVGNYSDYDSAGGMAVYGGTGTPTCSSFGECDCGNEGASISNCVTGNNRCWDLSTRGGQGDYAINGAIDLSGWMQLYTFLHVDSYLDRSAANTYTAGAITSPIAATATGQVNPGAHTALTETDTQTITINAQVYTWLVQPRTLWVGFTTTPPVLYNFVSPVPLGVGILLECQRDCFVSENNCYGNKGNAGLGVGILADGVMSTMFIDNKATGNAADIAGYAWGLADFDLTTANIWYKNWMYANRVDTWLNSSYLIVFDQTVVPGQALPLTTVYPGSTDTLTSMLPFDNIQVYFNQNRQISACVHENMELYWDTLTVIN